MVGTRISHIAGDASLADRTISSGSIRVLGILVANTSDAAENTTLIKDNDGDTIMTLEVGPNDSEDFTVPWVADNGFIVEAESDAATVFVTVVHGQEGA
jgi:hypothetical protein